MKDCLASIQNQTFKDFEVWIIDGNSGDGTKEYLETLKTPFHFLSEKDTGIYDAINKGIKLSKGKWLYFLGADDQFFNKDVLFKVFKLKFLESINIISGSIAYYKDDVPFIYNKNKKIKKASWNSSMWIRNGLHHQGTFYKKTLFNERLYNTKYEILADYDFNLSMYKANKQCFKTGLTIAKCSGKGISKSGSWKLYKEEYKLKLQHSLLILAPFHYAIVVVKYLLRKRING